MMAILLFLCMGSPNHAPPVSPRFSRAPVFSNCPRGSASASVCRAGVTNPAAYRRCLCTDDGSLCGCAKSGDCSCADCPVNRLPSNPMPRIPTETVVIRSAAPVIDYVPPSFSTRAYFDAQPCQGPGCRRMR